MTQPAIEQDAAVGLCWECGYPLKGLPTPRCPECGRGFDPADETTMNMGREVGWVARWLMRPPGWPMYLLLAGAVGVSLWACVVPTRRGAFSDILSGLLIAPPEYWGYRLRGLWGNLDRPEGRFLLGAVLWSVLAAGWISRRVARGVTVQHVSRQKAATFGYWRRWLVVPVVFGLTVCVCMTRVPTFAGFWVSKPWLEQAVREARAAPRRGLAARAMGLFGQYPGGFDRVGVESFQVDAGDGRAAVRLGYEADLVRRDDGRPPVLPPARRATRLSAHWFLVEPE